MINTKEHFWAKVEVGDSDSCWLWQGKPGADGYGYFRFEGKRRGVHGWSLTWSGNLPVPGKCCALHHCDTPLCVNPDHLYWGDRADNNRDRAQRGRAPKGSGHWASKLTESQVFEILEMKNQGASQASLARKFGVDPSLVSCIVRGKLWHHLST